MRNYSGFHTAIHPSGGIFVGEYSEQSSVLSVGIVQRMNQMFASQIGASPAFRNIFSSRNVGQTDTHVRIIVHGQLID